MNNTRNQLKGITIKVNVGGNGLKETTVVTNQGVAAKVVKLERPTVTQPAVKEEVIENHFNYVKVYASDETGVMTPEENVDFAVYNKNNELVMNLTTDKDGIIKFKLPYGTYTLRQMTSPKTHKKMDDLTLTVKEADVKINKVISNGEYKAKLSKMCRTYFYTCENYFFRYECPKNIRRIFK